MRTWIKRLRVLAVVAVLPFLTGGTVVIVAPASAPAGPTFTVETYETNPGTDLVWTGTPSAWLPDDTSGVIEGTESLNTTSNSSSTGASTHSITATDNLYLVAKNSIINSSAENSYLEFRFRNSTTNICSVRLLTLDGAPDKIDGMVVTHSSGATATSESTLNLALFSANVVKVAYNAGGGTDGYVQAWATTLADYNTNGWTNAVTITVNNSNDQAQVDNIQIVKSAQGVRFHVDSIRFSTIDDVDY